MHTLNECAYFFYLLLRQRTMHTLWHSEYVDPTVIENVVYVENSDELHSLAQITLSGQYNRVHNVVAHFVPRNVLIPP